MDISPSKRAILWRQVSGLASMQAAITLSWLIYRLYLPQLLTGFGFAGLDRIVQIIEDALAMAIEPLMGGVSDRTRQFMGTRFPAIVVGVLLSSALFIAIPAIFIFGKPIQSLHWLLPVMLILWAVAMAVFRSPAMALLGKYAAPAELPQAASAVVLAGGLVSAFRPISGNFILSLGPAFAFFIGSVALLAAIAVLRAVDRNSATPATSLPPPDSSQPLSIPALALLFAVSTGVAWGVRLGMGILPQAFKAHLPGIAGDWLMFGISIVLALLALPAGALAVRWGNHRAMLVGLTATAGLLLIVVFLSGAVLVVGMALAFVAFLSLVLNGPVPLALSLVPPRWTGLAVGMYFGGFTAGMSLFNAIFPKPPTLEDSAILGAIAFLVAGVGVLACKRFQLPPVAEV